MRRILVAVVCVLAVVVVARAQENVACLSSEFCQYLPIAVRAPAQPSPAPTALPLIPPGPPTSTTVPPTSTTVPPTATRDPAQCHPSYPTVCIPPPPPDLNCGDIPYRRFLVIGDDPHNFDSDNDGIGCESD
ncbi:MAG: hypothetical protein DIU80_011425 [Chloroflexota bacterium]